MDQNNETISRDFAFISDGLRLSGTIERPKKESMRGSILLLSGSGPQDRDESIAGQKPFLVLSRALAQRGYLVFRWDDRGVGDSEGDYLDASAEVLVGDVIRAMEAIEREVGIRRHVLVGHSQGTLIGTAVAARCSANVAGLILLAGMALPGREVLLEQHKRICKAEGWPDDDIQSSLAQKEALFDILLNAQAEIDSGSPAAAVLTNLKDDLLRSFLGNLEMTELSIDDQDALNDAIEDLLEWEWRYLLSVDPVRHLREVKCPILAVTGDRDSHVDAARNLSALEQACAQGGSPDVEVKILADHNHLFQVANSGALSEYAELGTPFSEGVLAIIGAWLLRTEENMTRR